MKRKIKLIISCIVFGIIFVCCGNFFRYILIDDTTSYTRIMFHEMYAQKNIDVLFVGSSHCYRSFDPEVIDEELGQNSFNAGTSSQHLDGSYMVIKEASKYNDIDHIYLELYFDLSDIVYKDRTTLTQTYIISDYLRPSLDKVIYLLNASAKDYYPNSFIIARRSWFKIFDDNYVRNLIIKKRTEEYKNFEYTYVTEDSEWYAGKGYVSSDEIIDNWNYFSDIEGNSINIDKVSEDWLNTLEDIIAFCDKQDIPLTLVSAPMPNFLLADKNYDEYVKFVRELIADTEIDYYDFNLCKEEYFPNTSSYFKDTDHLNCYGAEAFSRLFSDFINGKVTEDELFYDTYEEKIANLPPTVFGVSYHDRQDDNEEQIRDCKIVASVDEAMEYEIVLLPEGGERQILQEFSENRFFSVSPEDHGIIAINYRLSNSPEDQYSVDITY